MTENQFEVAQGIALSAGSLRKCEMCDETVLGDGGLAEPIARALRQFEAGWYTETFSSRAEIQQAVYTVINNYPTDDCRCSRALG